jgi:serine/threonine-protein kinase RsbT
MRGKPKKTLSPGAIQRLILRKPLDVAIARVTVSKLAGDLGYSLIDQERLATVIFEIVHHIVTDAGQGEIVISWYEDIRRKGLQFFCNDLGLRNPKLTTFLQTGGNETGNNLNLLGLKRLVDKFEVTEDPKCGNCVTMAIWLK